MNEGITHNYYWIESSDFGLHDLIMKCPDLFIEKTVAITSFDSGPLLPNDDEEILGWYSKDRVLYAPEVEDPKKLPYEQYDEWYIFDTLKEFKPNDTFVNYGSFFLRDPEYQLQDADPTWDKVGIKYQIDCQKERQEKFWQQVCRIEPRAFVLDGGVFIYGSMFPQDIELIKYKL